MFQIDIMSRVPVYEQLVNQIERYITSGVLKENEQIPSVRQLSASLSVNPNTIQKAISELDRRGLVYSVPGRGCFVKPEAKGILENRKREELPKLTEAIKQLALAGITKEEVFECVEKAFREGGAV